MTQHRIPGPRRRRVVVVLAGLTLMSACGSSEPASEDTPAASAPPATSSSTAPEPSASVAATSEVETTPIDGTWTTPTLAPSDFRRTLTRHGLGAHADTFLAGLGEAVDLTLEVGGGFWALSASINGEPMSMADRGTFEMQGRRVLVRPSSGGENLFRWRVADGELALALVSTTEPPYEGLPAETYQRGLYSTSPFRSVS